MTGIPKREINKHTIRVYIPLLKSFVRNVIYELQVENVRMLDRYSKTPSQGTLYVTATHLIFVDPDDKKETWVCVRCCLCLFILFLHLGLA